MPVQKCQENGNPGWRWGKSGKCYTYTKGDKEGSKRAHEKAARQGRAIQVNKSYTCECLECGYQMESDEHCKDIVCPKCGGEMRRVDRPGIGMAERHSAVQSVRFDKKKFNRSQAISWVKSHDFKSGDVEETQNQWRLRQFDPKKCLRSGGMKELAPGVTAYICPTKSTIQKAIDEFKVELENIKKCLYVEKEE